MKAILFTFAAISLAVFSMPSHADQFNVDEMPIGAEVTLPGAATTMAPIESRLKLGSTDTPQTVSIVPVPQAGGTSVPVVLSIFDSKQDRVKYVKIFPGAPFLYSFKGLSTITLSTDLPTAAGASKQAVRLKLESDKPLTVTRAAAETRTGI